MDPYNWGTLVTAIARNSGAEWFSQYPIGDASDPVRLIPELADMQALYPFSRDLRVALPFGLTNGDADRWATPVSKYGFVRFADHPLGQRLLRILDGAGLRYEIGPGGDELYCAFESGLGLVVEQVHLCVRPDNSAVLQWSSEILGCWADTDLSNPTLLYLQSRMLQLPAVLQAAFFLAESPYPSSATQFAIPRETALNDSGISQSDFPLPSVEWTDSPTFTVPEAVDGVVVGFTEREAPPWMVRVAYEISGALTDEQLQRCIKLAADALPRMHVMLVTGLLDGEAQAAAPFHEVLASDSELADADVFYLPYLSLMWSAN